MSSLPVWSERTGSLLCLVPDDLHAPPPPTLGCIPLPQHSTSQAPPASPHTITSGSLGGLGMALFSLPPGDQRESLLCCPSSPPGPCGLAGTASCSAPTSNLRPPPPTLQAVMEGYSACSWHSSSLQLYISLHKFLDELMLPPTDDEPKEDPNWMGFDQYCVLGTCHVPST